MNYIDTSKPVYFYDDRNKDHSLVKMETILYEDFHKCLCRVVIDEKDIEIVFFDKSEGDVLTTNFEFWCATNKIPILVEEDGEKEWRFEW